WDLATGRSRHTLHSAGKWLRDRIECLAVTPGGEVAVSVDTRPRVWDLAAGQYLGELEGGCSAAVSADGRGAITGGEDKPVRVWDLPAGSCRHALSRHGYRVQAVAVTPDGGVGLSASSFDDPTLRVWDLLTGRCLKEIGDAQEVWGISSLA